MAKKRDWTNEVEQACRNAVSAIPGFDKLSEQEWCEHVSEGLGVYLDGIEMRLEELKPSDE